MLDETLTPAVATASPAGSLSVGASLGAGVAQQGLAIASQIIQNKWNERMWNKQNEYNLPINQKQRLLDAGLNPALMYGNGSASTGNASTPPRMELNPGSIFDALQVASVASQIRSNNYRNKVLAAQARKENATADYYEQTLDDRVTGIKLTNTGKEIANTFKSLQADNQRFVNDHQAEVFAQNMENLKQSVLLKMEQISNTSARTSQIHSFLNEQFPAIVRLVSASADLAEAKARMTEFLQKNQGLSYYSDLFEGYLGTIFQGIGALTKIPGIGTQSLHPETVFIDPSTGEVVNP